jgi:hypothetical protein
MTKGDVMKLVELAGNAESMACTFSFGGRTLAERPDFEYLPDAGWRVAEKIAGSTSLAKKLPASVAFRWVRAAVAILSGKGGAAKDRAEVEESRKIHRSPVMAPILKAALLVPNAGSEGVGEALGIGTETVAAYADLFWNVPDRRNEVLYVASVMDQESGSDLDFSVEPAPLQGLIALAPRCSSIAQLLLVTGLVNDRACLDELGVMLHCRLIEEAVCWSAQPGNVGASKIPKLVEKAVQSIIDRDSPGAEENGMLSLADSIRGDLDRLSAKSIEEANRLHRGG